MSWVRARALGLVLTLAACGPEAPPEPPPILPVDPAVDVTPGFNEKEPDTCKASGLQYLIGQPATALTSLALPGPVRVIAPGEMFDQEEYQAARIDVRTDMAGIIRSIHCG